MPIALILPLCGRTARVCEHEVESGGSETREPALVGAEGAVVDVQGEDKQLGAAPKRGAVVSGALVHRLVLEEEVRVSACNDRRSMMNSLLK